MNGPKSTPHRNTQLNTQSNISPDTSTSTQTVGEDFYVDSSETTYKTSHTAVRKARRFAMQGLYEWLMTDHRFKQLGQGEWVNNAPHDIAARTRANNAMHTVHLGYYHDMMRDIPTQINELQPLIAEHLDRDIDVLDPIEYAILLIGTYELKNRLEIPYKVVLDEAMKLNTHFGATDAHKLINAVLDKLAPELRATEVAAEDRVPKVAKVKIAKTKVNKISSTDSPSNVQSNMSNDTELVTDVNEALKPSAKPRIGLNPTKARTASRRQRKVEPVANQKTAVAEKQISKEEIAAIKEQDDSNPADTTSLSLKEQLQEELRRNQSTSRDTNVSLDSDTNNDADNESNDDEADD